MKNLWFKVGFGLVAIVFLSLNFLSYFKASNRYDLMLKSGIRFSNGGFSWGFPLKMYLPSIGLDVVPTVFNVILAAACAGAVGLVLEVLAGKFRHEVSTDAE